MYQIIGGDGKEYGPVSADGLRQWITEGRVNAQTRVRLAEGGDWRPLSQLAEFGMAAAPAAPPLPASVPASVKVFAILNMVFGGLGLLCSPFSFLGIPASLRLWGDNGLVRTWLCFSAVWGVIGAVILLTSGIGLWRLKAWARRLAVFYAGLAILLGLVSLAMVVAAFGGNTAVAAPERIGGIIGVVVGGFFGLAYNGLLLFFLNRRSAREVFEAAPAS